MFSRTALLGFLMSLLFATTANTQVIPNTTYRLVPRTVYESQIVTKYRPQDEVVVEQKPVTTYRKETVTEMRERRYRVAKPVVETSERTERYTVRRPVQETTYRDEFVDRTRYETETTWEKQRRTVRKPVEETSERVESRTVCRPVTERGFKEETYTTYRPQTSTEVRWRDAGGYVNVPQVVPGAAGPSRLQWVPRTYYTNPYTGQPTAQRGGLYWVPQQGQPTVVNRPQYVPNYVPEEIERVSWVPEEVTRRVPVERTRYEEVVEQRRVPVTTYRMVEEEQYRYVPRTVKKPVTERFTRKVPVTKTKWVEEEVVKKVPHKTYRTVYEERVEKVPVEIERSVPVKQLMEREKTIRRYVPYKEERLVPKTVVERQLIPDTCGVPAATSSISYGTPVVGPQDGQTIRYGEWRAVTEPPAKSDADVRPALKPVVPESSSSGSPTDVKAEENPLGDNSGESTGSKEDRGSKPLLDLSKLLTQ